MNENSTPHQVHQCINKQLVLLEEDIAITFTSNPNSSTQLNKRARMKWGVQFHVLLGAAWAVHSKIKEIEGMQLGGCNYE